MLELRAHISPGQGSGRQASRHAWCGTCACRRWESCSTPARPAPPPRPLAASPAQRWHLARAPAKGHGQQAGTTQRQHLHGEFAPHLPNRPAASASPMRRGEAAPANPLLTPGDGSPVLCCHLKGNRAAGRSCVTAPMSCMAKRPRAESAAERPKAGPHAQALFALKTAAPAPEDSGRGEVTPTPHPCTRLPVTGFCHL